MKQGDVDAWRSVYAQYLPITWRTISARVGDMHAAEDLLSETMLAFFAAVDSMKSDCTISAWLRSVAKNKVSDYYRKQEQRNRLIRGAATFHGDLHFDVDRLAADEKRAHVAQVLDQLDEKERLALEWKYLDGESVRSIAERLGLTEKATESLLYRSRKAFRSRFDTSERFRGDPHKATNDSPNRTLKS